MNAAQRNRDIVVIGASAGGIEALSQIIAAIPEDLPASLFVAVHLSPVHQSRLPEIFMARGPWRALHPVDGQAIARRQIYIAPPDNHLFLRHGYMQVTRGPKENGHRPSVDALFRTAARAYGPRVIAVVLTGFLDCGTAGLLSVKARGGLALVQDPESAYAPEMPRSAIRHATVDEVLPLDRVAKRLIELVHTSAEPASTAVPRAVAEIEGDEPGVPAELVCPLCRGALTEASLGDFQQFQCHVGHTFSLQSILGQQTEETERALWASVRALTESAALATRMAGRNSGELRRRFQENAETLIRQASVIRAILTGANGDAPALENGRGTSEEQELE